jgi:serine phosphatase RsbU (regulator of sigma subunit)
MDIGLILFDTETFTLKFAGAHIPLIIAKVDENSGACSMEVIKGDSMPIGIHPKDETSFRLQELTASKGDTFYMFSDGFTSQFGGANFESFKTKKFIELLSSITSLPYGRAKTDTRANIF